MRLPTAFLLLAVLISTAQAEVRLPRMLSSHMVLQRDRPIHIWGWSDNGEAVSVTLGETKRSVTADDLGRWSVDLPPLPAGGPFSVVVEGSNNRIALDDVLVGDVWFASGQSNMEMPLKGFPGSAVIKNGAQEIQNASLPRIRLLLIDKKASPIPLSDFASGPGWTVCSPQTAADFSAVAYFFGRSIQQHEQVPVGLIDSSWGGTPAEAWTSMEGIAGDAGLMPVFAARAEMTSEQTDLPLKLAAEKRQDAEARTKNQPVPEHPWRPDLASWDPAWLYNGMVAPAVAFPIKGVIWYQGESNAGPERAFLYEKLFSTMISDWRAHWRQAGMPFLFVQISSFAASPKDEWPALREAQRRTLALRNTAMAVTIDIGERDNIHPADKQDVGERLALAARALAYGEEVEYSGPAYRQVSSEGSSLRVWFTHTTSGLTPKSGELQGFEIAGADRKYVPASAHVDGETVLVNASGVTAPRYVRYAWKDVPQANLGNGAGLPASPFTSDQTFSAR